MKHDPERHSAARAAVKTGLCRQFCVYHKPEKDEDLACLGFTVIEKLIRKGLRIPFDMPDSTFAKETGRMLLKVLCPACPFFADGCDFVTDSSRSPCGGFILLGKLLDKNVVCIDDIKNII